MRIIKGISLQTYARHPRPRGCVECEHFMESVGIGPQCAARMTSLDQTVIAVGCHRLTPPPIKVQTCQDCGFLDANGNTGTIGLGRKPICRHHNAYLTPARHAAGCNSYAPKSTPTPAQREALSSGRTCYTCANGTLHPSDGHVSHCSDSGGFSGCGDYTNYVPRN